MIIEFSNSLKITKMFGGFCFGDDFITFILMISATKGNTLKEEWIAYICREMLRVSSLSNYKKNENKSCSYGRMSRMFLSNNYQNNRNKSHKIIKFPVTHVVCLCGYTMYLPSRCLVHIIEHLLDETHFSHQWSSFQQLYNA